MIMIILKASATLIMAGILFGLIRRNPDVLFDPKGLSKSVLKLTLKLPNGDLNLRGITFLISSCWIFLCDDITTFLYLIMFQVLLRWSCYAPKGSGTKIKAALRWQSTHR